MFAAGGGQSHLGSDNDDESGGMSSGQHMGNMMGGPGMMPPGMPPPSSGMPRMPMGMPPMGMPPMGMPPMGGPMPPVGKFCWLHLTLPVVLSSPVVVASQVPPVAAVFELASQALGHLARQSTVATWWHKTA